MHLLNNVSATASMMMIVLSLGETLNAAELPSGDEIIKHCEYKDPGEDQRTRLTVILIDKEGGERKNVYRRLWKNYYGKQDIVDKMVLFTEFPPDAKGTGFMRWGYTSAAAKPADQWLYLPQLRKIRRVSVRDPGDSFLGSDLSYGDIDERLPDADQHVVLRIDEINESSYYVVESTPKEAKPLYSKKISWYKKTEAWDDCIRAKTDYFDLQGALLKTQSLTWQKVAGAWAWEKVVVENVQTDHKSIFGVSDVEIAVGLKDSQFTERNLIKQRD